jgi:hypothetical protein
MVVFLVERRGRGRVIDSHCKFLMKRNLRFGKARRREKVGKGHRDCIYVMICRVW